MALVSIGIAPYGRIINTLRHHKMKLHFFLKKKFLLDCRISLLEVDAEAIQSLNSAEDRAAIAQTVAIKTNFHIFQSVQMKWKKKNWSQSYKTMYQYKHVK